MAECCVCGGVPESNTAIGGASTRGQKPVLVGAPRDGLHRRGVLGELEHGRGRGGVPHKQVVVVAPGGKLAVVVGPLQAAHL
eukprot:CAMPEP_0114241028 /NCGR_PEP_ID=MMETSP0058-20121206/9419_1 /TAXON_ID=36894 /ORGANISM="Pyramimonas parkeae, CCMP726" /LENGTH=81 /DNA_ID=CAMNT_0001353537 /DNA_START=552 /DNA_END=797 /DNA_ORIENTATION=+